MTQYAFDLGWESERSRIAAGETLFDPFTTQVIGGFGVADGWRCLEIGAGGGTVAGWMCEQAAPTGEVLAIDLDTRFVERLPHANLEVRKHDVSTGLPDDRRYDLIHGRLVLEHVPNRSEVVTQLIGALKPGGWILLEDVDLTEQPHLPPQAYFEHPRSSDQLLARATDALCEVLRQLGVELDYGRALPSELLSNGLEDVDARYQTQLARGGTARADYTRLMFAFLRDELIARGHLTSEEHDRVMARHDDPNFCWMSVPLFSAWGRKPCR